MLEDPVRADLLARLNRITKKLPNGLLHRLVEDARFFDDWNQAKRKARRSRRFPPKGKPRVRDAS